MFPRLRGRWRWLALGGVVCVVAAGAAVAFLMASQPGDVSNPDVEFTDTQATSPTSTQREPKATEHPMDDGFAWPDFGYDEGAHALPASEDAAAPALRGAVARDRARC